MTVDEVLARVASIYSVRHDYEAAHSSEDGLHQDVLRAIAAMGGEAGALAEAALKTCDLDFARWCA